VIRDAAPGDLEAIVEIYNATIDGREATADLEPVTVAQRRRWFRSHLPERRPLWVVEVGGEVVAWLSFEDFYGRAAYAATAEISVYVRSDHRGRGLGRALCERAVGHAPRLGLSTLVAFVFAHNAASVALFARAGFERWGELPGVARLDERRADLLILGRRV
jgi:L-amino acid N-acyltransferase YncA